MSTASPNGLDIAKLDIRAIAAVSRDGVIGIDGHLPWKIPEDVDYLHRCVRGGTVIEGRKCYESREKPFPGANRTLVLSGRDNWNPPEVEVYSSLSYAYKAVQGTEQPVWIAGGERVYRESLPHWKRLYLTVIHDDFQGDTFFPEWRKHFPVELSRKDGEHEGLRYSFLILAPNEVK